MMRYSTDYFLYYYYFYNDRDTSPNDYLRVDAVAKDLGDDGEYQGKDMIE